MAQMITVTARTPFVYQTRALSVGDRFECPPVWAAILRDQGKIALASDPQPVAPESDAPPETCQPVPVRTSRRARRALMDTLDPVDPAVPA